MTDFYASGLGAIVEILDPGPLSKLVSIGSVERIGSLVGRLPAAAIEFFGFERTLGADDRNCDFAVCLRFGREYLIYETPHLSSLGCVVDTWRTLTGAQSNGIWLEFDTSRRSAGRIPNVFLAADRDGADALVSPEALVAWLGEVWSPTRLRDVDLRRSLNVCTGACPGSVNRLLVGLMFDREVDSVRMCFTPMTLSTAKAYLENVSWAGDLKRLETVMSPFVAFVDTLCLQVDVGETIGPRIAFELQFAKLPWQSQPPNEPRWLELLDLLVLSGLCTYFERDALLGFVSSTEFSAPLIERLIDAVTPSPQRILHGTLYTGLNHVKLTVDCELNLSAKIYLGVYLDS